MHMECNSDSNNLFQKISFISTHHQHSEVDQVDAYRSERAEMNCLTFDITYGSFANKYMQIKN